MRTKLNLSAIAAILLALGLFISPAGALEMKEFMYSVELKASGVPNNIYMAPLTVEMAERSRAGYEDLRVLSADSAEVPYVILDDRTPPEYVNNYYLMSVSDYRDETDSAVLVMKMPDKRKPVEILEIETFNTDFKKHVILYGGNDDQNWEQLAEEPVFDFSSQVNYRKTDFKLGRKCDFKYYKFVIKNFAPSKGGSGQSIKLSYEGLDFSVDKFNEQKLKIEGVNARTAFNVKKDGTKNYDEKVFDKLNITTDKANNTVIDIEADLYFDRIVFDISAAYYRRNVKVYYSETGVDDSYRYMADFSVYNIPLDEYRTTRGDWWYSSPKHRFFRFVIENKNNPPLAVNKISFAFVRKNLFFAPAAASAGYYICFGNKTLKRPEYDISSFINERNWHKQNYSTLSGGPLTLNASYKEEKAKEPMRPEVEKALLTVIVIIVIAALGYWLFNLMAAVPREGETGGKEGNGSGAGPGEEEDKK